MQAYINILLEDIASAHCPEDYFNKLDNTRSEMDLEQELEESERFIFYDREPLFEVYCGLKRENFPPKDRLSEDQLTQVTVAFIKMMSSWSLFVDFPDDLPQLMRYELLLDILQKPVMISQYGFFGFDYCNGNPVGCELGEYCSCLKIV
jgi:hypothetical protein